MHQSGDFRRPGPALACLVFLGLVSLCGSPSAVATPPTPETQTKQIADQIDAFFAPVIGVDAPGASVMVIQEGSILYQNSYGMADIEHGVPNTRQTKYRLGSLTKSFTSTAVLRLHEQGLLDIDDPVSKYLPDLHDAEKMTVRHLLTHTAGLSESEEEPLISQPGDRINYSNFGYNQLGDILEKVSGKSYEACIQEQIFQPLGMLDSGYDSHTTILKNRASGYTNAGNGEFVNADYIDMSGPHAAGALYSTVADLYLWDKALSQGTLLSDATRELAFTRTKLSGGREAAYGMGWMLNDFGGLQEIGHGGDITGFSSYYARFPEQQFSVIVLSNIGMHPPGPLPNAGDVAHRIAQLYLGDLMEAEEPFVEMELSTEILDRYVGTYQLSAPQVVIDVAGTTLTITREESQLFAISNMGKARLQAISELEFLQEGMPLTLIFGGESQSRATEIMISAGGLREFAAKRVE